MQRPGVALRRIRRAAQPSALRSAAGFTLVELIAAVALLIILVGILFVVFGEASKTVSIGQERLARCTAVRGFLRLLEEDLANAFLMHDEDGNTYGLVGVNGADPAFLVGNYADGTPVQPSDRLTLVRLRPSQSVAANRPGLVEVCYLRHTYPQGQELVSGRRNVLFRVADENMTGWPPATPGQPFPSGFLAFSVPDPASSSNDDYFRRYIVALDVSDLQFRYLKVDRPGGAPTLQDSWNYPVTLDPGTDTYDPDGSGPLAARAALPTVVEVTIRMGPDSNPQEIDPNTKEVIHESFTQLIRLPVAP